MSNKEKIFNWLQESGYKNFEIEGEDDAKIFYVSLNGFSSFSNYDVKRIPKGWRITTIWPNVKHNNGNIVAYLMLTVRTDL